jgi:hypothetical protein
MDELRDLAGDAAFAAAGVGRRTCCAGALACVAQRAPHDVHGVPAPVAAMKVQRYSTCLALHSNYVEGPAVLAANALEFSILRAIAVLRFACNARVSKLPIASMSCNSMK